MNKFRSVSVIKKINGYVYSRDEQGSSSEDRRISPAKLLTTVSFMHTHTVGVLRVVFTSEVPPAPTAWD